MLKIKTDNETFIIPTETPINIIVDNGNKNTIIDCLSSYFNKKKKTLCMVYDEENDLVKYDEVNFIYTSSISSTDDEFSFKPKTILNTEISQIIEQNPEKFQSVDRIRESIHDLLTDSGIYELKGILEKNTDSHFDIDINDFSISKLVSMLSIEAENLTLNDKMIAIINLLLFLNRDKMNVIYIDIPLDEKMCKWINNTASKDLIFLIDNTCISSNDNLDVKTMVLLENSNDCVKFDVTKEYSDMLVYLFNPVVINNLKYQNEKIIELYSEFCDLDKTFLLNIC